MPTLTISTTRSVYHCYSDLYYCQTSTLTTNKNTTQQPRPCPSHPTALSQKAKVGCLLPTPRRGQTDLSPSTGLLHPVGDPVGRGLKTVLRPTVGHITAQVGEPSGQAAENVQDMVKDQHKWTAEEKDEKDMPGGKRIGGNAQSGGNPLGL